MKSYIKKKAGPKLGYRTPKNFKGKVFSGKGSPSKAKFHPASFKVQHRG